MTLLGGVLLVAASGVVPFKDAEMREALRDIGRTLYETRARAAR